MFCCCNHNKKRSPHCSSFLKIKFFSPHEGLNEAFIYATTIKPTMAPIQFAAPCDARRHAEVILLIQNTNDKMFIGCHEPGLGKGSVPKDPEMSGVYLFLPTRIMGSILQFNKKRHSFSCNHRGGRGRPAWREVWTAILVVSASRR